MIGTAIGISFLFRVDSIVLVASILLFLPLFRRMRDLLRSPWILVGLVVPILAAGAFQGWYNDLRFGSITSFGYPGGAYGSGLSSFSTPLLTGLQELLRWPHKGFFWFNPLLLTALPGFIWLARRNRAIAITIFGMAIIRLLVYAKWFVPDGGVGWGPRLLFPLCATLMIPACEAWQRVARLRGLARARSPASCSRWHSRPPHSPSCRYGCRTSKRGTTSPTFILETTKAIWTNASTATNAPSAAARSSRACTSARLFAPFPLWHFDGGPDTTGWSRPDSRSWAVRARGLVARQPDRRSPRRTAPSGA